MSLRADVVTIRVDIPWDYQCRWLEEYLGFLSTCVLPHVPHVTKQCKRYCVRQFSFDRYLRTNPNSFSVRSFRDRSSCVLSSLKLIGSRNDQKGLRWLYNVVIILSELPLFGTVFPNGDLDKVANGVRRKAFPCGAVEREGVDARG